MQGYDLIMLIVLGMATIFGAIKGFAWQVASLASVIVSYIVAYRFRFAVAEMISAKPPWNQFLAMLILYVSTSFVIWVGFRLLSSAIDRVRLKEFDRHLGAGFGLAKGLVYCLLITMFAMSLLGPSQQAAICQSRSGYYISVALDRGVGILPKEIHDVVGPYLTGLDEKLNDHESHQDFHSPGANRSSGILPSLQQSADELPQEISQGLGSAARQVQDAIGNQLQQQFGNQFRDAAAGFGAASNAPANLPNNQDVSRLNPTGQGGGNILPPPMSSNFPDTMGSVDTLPNAGVFPSTGTQPPQLGQPPMGLRPAHTSSGSQLPGTEYGVPR